MKEDMSVDKVAMEKAVGDVNAYILKWIVIVAVLVGTAIFYTKASCKTLAKLPTFLTPERCTPEQQGMRLLESL